MKLSHQQKLTQKISFFLVVALVLVFPAAMTYGGAFFNGLGPSVSGFSDILANPNDHWSWDGPTITYQFDPAFTATLPAGQATAIRDQIRLAFEDWTNADTTGCGAIYSYNRQGPSMTFGDIRSIALHEIGHTIGLGHPNQTGFGMINYRRNPVCAGPWALQGDNGDEVMRSFIQSGEYNHILTHDELDAFGFVYPSGLTFVEVAPPAPADIVITNYTNSPTNWAQGPPTGLDRPGTLTGTQITSANIFFNTASSTPIGFRTLGINWDYDNISGQNVVSFEVQTRGTNNLNTIFHYDGAPSNKFLTYTTAPMGINLKDDILHTWSNHNSGGVAPGGIVHVGLELDVHDWTVVSAEAVDAFSVHTPLPLVGFHDWNNFTQFNFTSGGDDPVKALEESHQKGHHGHDDHGINRPPTEPMFVKARGFSIRNNQRTVADFSEIILADAGDFDLELADLNRPTLNALAKRRLAQSFRIQPTRVEPGESFVVVLEGNEEDLPQELREQGNFVLLETDGLNLLDTELFIFVETRNTSSIIGTFGLLGTPPIALPSSRGDDDDQVPNEKIKPIYNPLVSLVE